MVFADQNFDHTVYVHVVLWVINYRNNSKKLHISTQAMYFNKYNSKFVCVGNVKVF